MSLQFSADAKRRIEVLTTKYPSKQPVVLAALHLAQKEFGSLNDEALAEVAQTLDLPLAHVHGVATFYTMFKRHESGTNTVRVCTNISCMLRGAYDVLRGFEKELSLKVGDTNAKFHLVEEECIAACANAPAVVVGTKYFLDVTPEQVKEIVAYLNENLHPESEVA